MSVVLRSVALFALAFAALMVWRASYAAGCAALAVPAVVTVLIAWQSFEYGLARRRCFADCFFRHGSLLHRLFRGWLVSLLFAVLGALALSAFLFQGLATWDPPILIALGAVGLAIALLQPPLARAARGPARPKAARIAAKYLTVGLGGAAATLALAWLFLDAEIPSYARQGGALVDLIRAAAESTGSACPAVDDFLRLSAAKDGLVWWLILKADESAAGPGYRAAAWALFLIGGALGAIGYARYVAQCVSFAHKGAANRGDADDDARA